MKRYQDLLSNFCLVLLVVAACNGQYDYDAGLSDASEDDNPKYIIIDTPNYDEDVSREGELPHNDNDNNEFPISDEPSNIQEDDFVDNGKPDDQEDVPNVDDEQPENENNKEQPTSVEPSNTEEDVQIVNSTPETNDYTNNQEDPSTSNEEPSTERGPSNVNVQPPQEGGPSDNNDVPPQNDNNIPLDTPGSNTGSLLPTSTDHDDDNSHDHGHDNDHHGHGNDHGHGNNHGHGHNQTPKCNVRFGFMGVAGSCDSYIECRKGKARKRFCPDGMFFNKKARWSEYPCGYPSDVPCPSFRGDTIQKARPTPFCKHQYGFFPIVTEDTRVKCSQYIMCSAGTPHIMNCSISLVFNPKVGRCDWPENVESCKNYMGFVCPRRAEEYFEEDPIDFATIENFKHESKCSYFWSCLRGQARLLRCDYGMYFDQTFGRCLVDQEGVCDDYDTPGHESEENNSEEEYEEQLR